MFTPRPNLLYVTVELNLTGLPNYASAVSAVIVSVFKTV